MQVLTIQCTRSTFHGVAHLYILKFCVFNSVHFSWSSESILYNNRGSLFERSIDPYNHRKVCEHFLLQLAKNMTGLDVRSVFCYTYLGHMTTISVMKFEEPRMVINFYFLSKLRSKQSAESCQLRWWKAYILHWALIKVLKTFAFIFKLAWIVRNIYLDVQHLFWYVRR